jgi:hypothetical protein
VGIGVALIRLNSTLNVARGFLIRFGVVVIHHKTGEVILARSATLGTGWTRGKRRKLDTVAAIDAIGAAKMSR